MSPRGSGVLCRKAIKPQIVIPMKAGTQFKIVVYGFRGNPEIAISTSFSTEQV